MCVALNDQQRQCSVPWSNAQTKWKYSHILPSPSLWAGESNEELMPGQAQRIAGHQAEISSAWHQIILFKELSPVERSKAQKPPFGIRQNAWHAVRGFCLLRHFTWHLQPTLSERIEQRQNGRRGCVQWGTLQINTYLFFSWMFGCLSRLHTVSYSHLYDSGLLMKANAY